MLTRSSEKIFYPMRYAGKMRYAQTDVNSIFTDISIAQLH